MMKRIQIGPWRARAPLSLAVLALLLGARGSQAASAADVDAVVRQSRAAKSGDDFLPPEQAFRLSASAESAERVHLTWLIAPGYYLYRDRTKVAGEAGQDTLGPLEFPEGQIKSDEYFGQQVVYHDELVVTLPVKRSAGDRKLLLNVTYQGCAEAGLCYPPVTR